MKQEYCFNLTAPLADLAKVEELLQEAKQKYPKTRISRKTDRKQCARFYLSFPFSDARPDLAFQEWFTEKMDEAWELFGPNYGRWGLC